ncbi:MAG TPA: P1 family peptidase [Verrucomicrobiae bacterium]|nr:P1 family peptidase [Verrucomicrobiae bacterium]
MTKPRDLGIVIGSLPPGVHNAITDVPGVLVGHTTLVEGEGALRVGRGPIRTGVTVILPRPGPLFTRPLFAGCHRLNGNGELTGLEWIRESGLLTTPIALTNTLSVGTVRDALIGWEVGRRRSDEIYWSLPVVGETWDGLLNDIAGQHVQPAHLARALESAAAGAVPQGAVGGGTGMICHGFKGGIGSASRVVETAGERCTIGVLVQANHGRRSRLTVAGAPVGLRLPEAEVPVPRDPRGRPPGSGSIIVVVATDAPLLPDQCRRLAQRATLGIGRTGGLGEHSSGDLALCFATGNAELPDDPPDGPDRLRVPVAMLDVRHIDQLFAAVVEATEEAILSALLAAATMTGRDGITAHALDPDRLIWAMSSA